MGPNRDPEVDEPQPVKYPSPDAEVMDAGPFYNTGGRDEAQEHRDEAHHLPDDVELHDHVAEAISGDESGSPQQHLSRPANLEELQLAAQLGHGLAGTPIMPATDPQMHVDDANLRSIMPHPGSENHDCSPFSRDAPNADAMAQHSLQDPSASMLSAPHFLGGNIPPRKRSKVSRACDECRRKKIKCDAVSDTGDPPCSSCARTSARCLFSRVPQKRGPSKGYIKELADRIHSIEYKLGSEGGLNTDDVDRLFATSRPRNDDQSRKRPFFSISTGDASAPVQARLQPWGSDSRSLDPTSTSPDGQTFKNSSLAPKPSALKPDATPAKSATSENEGAVLESQEVPAIDEVALNDFLTHVQPICPILPHSAERLNSLLSQSSPTLRIAFTTALQAMTHREGDAKVASLLLNDWESNDEVVTEASKIVHAQTLLILIIDADWQNSSTLPFLLGRAVALANSMKLWKLSFAETVSELDSDDRLWVRIWWSLVLMDRWHAAGTGTPSQIPDTSVVVPAGLENVVGDGCFHLIRLSKLLNRISFVVSNLPPGGFTADLPMAAILNDYIENYREDLPVLVDPVSHPLVHLAYWHCRLLVTLLTPGATTAEDMWPTKEMANLLLANPELRSPLLNHFVALVAMSLAKLCRLDKSRDEATQLAKEIADSPGLAWESVRGKLAELTRPASSVEATASQGLQHLAHLATAHEDAAGENDLAIGPSLASGYLNAI